MTFRAMPLRRLRRLARCVSNDVAAAAAAQHRGGRALARVLAMRETQLAAAFRAATARFRLSGDVAAHRRKSTAPAHEQVGAARMATLRSSTACARSRDPHPTLLRLRAQWRTSRVGPAALRPVDRRRAAALRAPLARICAQHPGQIAFPGGSAEPTDADVVATALREAQRGARDRPRAMSRCWACSRRSRRSCPSAGSPRSSGCNARPIAAPRRRLRDRGMVPRRYRRSAGRATHRSRVRTRRHPRPRALSTRRRDASSGASPACIVHELLDAASAEPTDESVAAATIFWSCACATASANADRPVPSELTTSTTAMTLAVLERNADLAVAGRRLADVLVGLRSRVRSATTSS